MEVIKINDFDSHKIGEDQVIKRILGGEKELYEILVRRNNQKLYRIIRSYLKEDAEIEDIMQDCYVKAFTKLYQFKFDSAFSTWLIRIGINEALARLTEKGRLYQLDDQVRLSTSNSIFEIPDSSQLNPQDRMIGNEAKKLLESAIDSLDPKYRIVYIMKEVEEMTSKEISIALDLTVANVKVRLHRSKEMLKEKLYQVVNDREIFEFGFSRCDRITEKIMTLI